MASRHPVGLRRHRSILAEHLGNLDACVVAAANVPILILLHVPLRECRVVPAGHQALDGEGTRRFGSRWVPKGLPAVYTSATLSLATLELFVHTDPDLAPADLLAISADIPDDVFVHELALSDLPGSWRDIPAPAELQELGRSWLVEGKAAMMGPTAIVATNDVVFGMARMYAILTEDAGVRVEVFRDVESATRWLQEASK